MQAIARAAGTRVDAYGFALIPEITGAVGAVVSCFSGSGTDVVPPALAALHVSAAAPSPGAAAKHPAATSTTGDSGSETLQATLAGARYQPFAPSGAAGVMTGVMTGGVGSSAIARARSAR